jgi:hypothetical protein
MMITPRLRLATGALALTTLLAACGDSTEPAGGGSTTTATGAEQAAQEHNEADTMFAQMMIVHHEGAVEMAQLAQEQAVTPEVQELAGQIEQAQGPEIELMQSWLQQWGEPAASDGDMAGMDHGDMGGVRRPLPGADDRAPPRRRHDGADRTGRGTAPRRSGARREGRDRPGGRDRADGAAAQGTVNPQPGMQPYRW